MQPDPNRDRLLRRILSGQSDNNIRFNDLRNREVGGRLTSGTVGSVMMRLAGRISQINLLAWIKDKTDSARWECLEVKDWPLWVRRSVTNDDLHKARDNKAPLTRHGRTFEYRVWPLWEDQGHWSIDRIYRRLKRE